MRNERTSASYPQIEGLGIYVLLVTHSSRDSDPLVGKLRDEKNPFNNNKPQPLGVQCQSLPHTRLESQICFRKALEACSLQPGFLTPKVVWFLTGRRNSFKKKASLNFRGIRIGIRPCPSGRDWVAPLFWGTDVVTETRSPMIFIPKCLDKLASSPSKDVARLCFHRSSTSSSIHSRKRQVQLLYFKVDPAFASPSGSQSNRVCGPKTILIASLALLGFTISEEVYPSVLLRMVLKEIFE
ncbi:hypothetical protein Fot_37390 [Forsythia ovata]|uniref:Uncharacterized protein n=1 Tax=Forsythia ovata TaxID=205694 RepID=A0ABD1RZE3_9LAMI